MQGGLQHVASGECLGSQYNGAFIVLQPCLSQPLFEYVEQPGWVRQRPSWEDNGRRIYLATCLDSQPAPLWGVSPQSCRTTRKGGIRWQRLNVFVPPEYESLMKHTETNAPPLGGGVPPEPPQLYPI